MTYSCRLQPSLVARSAVNVTHGHVKKVGNLPIGHKGRTPVSSDM